MRKPDPLWLEIFSELFVNLAAGWFAAIFAVPNFYGIRSVFDFSILTGNFAAGILSLGLSYRLRRLAKL